MAAALCASDLSTRLGSRGLLGRLVSFHLHWLSQGLASLGDGSAGGACGSFPSGLNLFRTQSNHRNYWLLMLPSIQGAGSTEVDGLAR